MCITAIRQHGMLINTCSFTVGSDQTIHIDAIMFQIFGETSLLMNINHCGDVNGFLFSMPTRMCNFPSTRNIYRHKIREHTIFWNATTHFAF